MSMDISKLPSNSNASKTKTQTPAPTSNTPAEKKVEKVVTGKVKTKKNEIRKFTDIFVAEDVGSVKSYILDDLLIPTVKNLFVDIVQNSIEMLILGGKRGGSGRRSGVVDNVSYRDYGKYSRDDRNYASSGRSRNNFDYDDIIFETRGDAEAVLDQLGFIINKYGLARVADLYDMCELTAPYTAHDYGWTSLARARVTSVRGGYIIELPRAAAID